MNKSSSREREGFLYGHYKRKEYCNENKAMEARLVEGH